MGTEKLNLIAAFMAGVLSFFSPCVLPLVPVYLGYMTGTAVGRLAESGRLRTILHALFFVVGFGLVFVATGAAAGALGNLIYPLMPVLVRIGGLFLIVLGLHLSGLITIPFLAIERRLELGASAKKGYWASFLVGVVFAVGWTPCVGPVLAAILLLAADSQTTHTGALLLATYALGLGLPFLLVAALVHVALPVLKKVGHLQRASTAAGGILLVTMGFLLLTGLWQGLVAWVSALFPAWTGGT